MSLSKSTSQKAILEDSVNLANGLLPMPVYHALWEAAGLACGPVFVEVGTAHGAATIAMALGTKNAGIHATIHTIDRLEGKFSSRSAFGSCKDNEKIVLDNFNRTGVGDIISLFVGTSDQFAAADICPSKIDFLLLDADGRIDRDLMHFYPRLQDGATLVIDDVDPYVFLGKNHEGIPYIDLKHRISSLLLKAFEAEGFIKSVRQIENTAFCKRGDRVYDRILMTSLALDCYRELVFAEASDPFWREISLWKDRADLLRASLSIYTSLPLWCRNLARRLIKK